MEEENKITEIKSTLKMNSSEEIRNQCIKKPNPGFNLVSLKARQRLNLFKELLSKYEYRDYIRKCKNMYSISSLMNNHYSMSDLYLSERANMPDIINLFKKLDSKINQKKLKLKKIKKNNINDSSVKENMSLSQTNIINNSINRPMKLNYNNFNLSDDNRMTYQKNERKCLRNKTISFNIQKINYFNFSKRTNIKRKSHNNIKFFVNPNMNHSKKTIIDNNIKDNESNNLKKNLNSNNIIFKSIQSDRSPNNISLSPFISKYKIKNIYSEKNKTIINERIKKLQFKYNNEIRNKNIIPFSTKNKNFSITHYGAIIYNNSILRKKGIENFLPNYYNLPLLYGTKK